MSKDQYRLVWRSIAVHYRPIYRERPKGIYQCKFGNRSTQKTEVELVQVERTHQQPLILEYY
jgi:hypothetical protein